MYIVFLNCLERDVTNNLFDLSGVPCIAYLYKITKRYQLRGLIFPFLIQSVHKRSVHKRHFSVFGAIQNEVLSKMISPETDMLFHTSFHLLSVL